MSFSGSALILEDEPIIAFALEDMLIELGFGTILLATTIPDASGRLDDCTPDLAVLDVNIHGERSYPVAERLAQLGVPFVFATGYGDAEHPDELKSVPTLTKPYTLAALHDALTRAAQA